MELDSGQQAALAALTAGTAHGFYLWGDVGRGKTMLADRFAASLATTEVERVHFHGFLRALHRRIAAERAPLPRVLSQMLGDVRVLVFDEFHVHDVADAVFLTALLEHVLEHRILLVATSNYPPQELLPDPLFHHRMEKAIGLIEEHLTVVPIGDGPDYRGAAPSQERTGFAAGRWVIGSGPDGAGDRADRAARPVTGQPVVVRAAGIPVQALHVTDTELVCTFSAVCEQAVGTHQYLWIAESFQTVTIVDVPDLAAVRRDALLRFALLADILCDRETALVVHARSEAARLLLADEPPRDASRTLSRLSLLGR
ncbi:cell division protein ZapE [Brevibacterium yomogidense]|uniref:ATPase n=1 Tax=Brevibacterium yomogidense TaxID=946573 RepID=A0A1X6X5E6_9MICO|nr:cell division protein ZapE [Brevibacterium yomogidense]SLM94268.1 ATPase [Brevibacterium yomogidense]